MVTLTLDDIPAPAGCWDRDGLTQSLNQSWIAKFGACAEEKSPARLTDWMLPEERNAFGEAWAEARATGTALTRILPLRCCSGTYRAVHLSLAPADRGIPLGLWYGVCADVEELVAGERQAREAEKFFRLLADAIPVQVWAAHPSGATFYRNRHSLEYTGRPEPGLPQMGWPTTVHPEDRDNAAACWHKAVAEGSNHRSIFRYRRTDGEYRWFEARADPLVGPDGKVHSWYAVDIDIDDNRRLEDALRASQEKLSRAAHLATLGELSASIAHEINQPLAAVVANGHACSSWLALDPPNLVRARDSADDIIAAGTHAAEIVRRIRGLFKHAALVRASLDINETIREVLDLMAQESRTADIRVALTLAEPLPAVSADRIQVQQVLVNILRNALEAMNQTPRSERTLAVTTTPESTTHVLVAIRDAGAGVAEPDKAFEPFYTTKADGMGMGLAISRSIIDAHGGKLWMQSNESAGMTVLFSLPLQAKD